MVIIFPAIRFVKEKPIFSKFILPRFSTLRILINFPFHGMIPAEVTLMTGDITMQITDFGTTPGGETVYAIELDNGMLKCRVITFGATLQSLIVPDKDGHPVDVVLGFDSLEGYRTQGGYLGATVGRFANRIADGRFSLNGQTYTLTRNIGTNHLHGGKRGFSHRIWDIAETQEHAVTLQLFSPDGEEGYPGNLQCRVQYALEENALVIRYHAVTDRDTVCSLTNHSYFNLEGGGSVLNHSLELFAHFYTPSKLDSIPKGTVVPVAGTPMDFTIPTPIGARIAAPFSQLLFAGGYDHNYVIDGPTGTLRPMARATAFHSGIILEAETTLPGFQFYSGNYLPKGHPGKGGCIYKPRHGFCLEAQFFPDSPNQPNFPSPVLRSGEEFDHCTVFRFHT